MTIDPRALVVIPIGHEVGEYALANQDGYKPSGRSGRSVQSSSVLSTPAGKFHRVPLGHLHHRAYALYHHCHRHFADNCDRKHHHGNIAGQPPPSKSLPSRQLRPPCGDIGSFKIQRHTSRMAQQPRHFLIWFSPKPIFLQNRPPAMTGTSHHAASNIVLYLQHMVHTPIHASFCSSITFFLPAILASFMHHYTHLRLCTVSEIALMFAAGTLSKTSSWLGDKMMLGPSTFQTRSTSQRISSGVAFTIKVCASMPPKKAMSFLNCLRLSADIPAAAPGEDEEYPRPHQSDLE